MCDIFEVPGCTDPTNPGYNPYATDDDGSCLVGGCVFPTACNYDPEADYQIIGSCDFITCQGCTDPKLVTTMKEQLLMMDLVFYRRQDMTVMVSV